MAVIISRHCVAQREDGLSPLQAALIEDKSAPIRVVSAPTGAGKSYAFLEAVNRGQRVLLLVPTRRLARNLAASLVKTLADRPGWSKTRAEKAVAFWSSEQRLALREQGERRPIAGIRLQQMEGLTPLGEGELIVAIPETVSHLLVQRRLEKDQAGKGVFDLLDAFDHIVFDEFHTIEARGFGLAGLFCRLVAEGYGRARVSFLSATPVDLSRVFQQLDISPQQVAYLQETLVPEGRPLHGDVALHWSDAPGLPEILAQEQDAVLAEVRGGRQVVIIYDALADLERDLPRLSKRFRQWGLDPGQVLVINSIRDSAAGGTLSCGFASGRSRNPDDYDILIATASVEVGITFRDARLLLMEPGFSPLNFLQRYGRAARRGSDGRVVVRAGQNKRDRLPWLRKLVRWLDEHAGQRQDIEALTRVLAGETAGRYFGSLPQRAAACCGVYWQLLLNHPSNRGPRYNRLLDAQPEISKKIFGLLKQVEALAETPECRPHVTDWIEQFKDQAACLRAIGTKVTVVQEDGTELEVDEVWLRRETRIFERFLLDESERKIRISGFLDDWFRDDKDHGAKRHWSACFPHTGQKALLPWDDKLVNEWCNRLESVDPYSLACQDHPKAMEAAHKLVRWTGLVPGHDAEISVEAQHGVL